MLDALRETPGTSELAREDRSATVAEKGVWFLGLQWLSLSGRFGAWLRWQIKDRNAPSCQPLDSPVAQSCSGSVSVWL